MPLEECDSVALGVLRPGALRPGALRPTARVMGGGGASAGAVAAGEEPGRGGGVASICEGG